MTTERVYRGLTAEEVAQFEKDGYLEVEDAIPAELIQRMREDAAALAEQSTEGVRPFHERALFRRKSFRDLIYCEGLTRVAESLLGADVQLLALDLLFTRPANRSTPWHADVVFSCNKTLSMNTGIYLQDLNPEIGQLGVVPGSHRWQRVPSGEEMNGTPPGALWLSPRAGSAVFFDAALWHTGGLNRTDRIRTGVFAYFGHYFMKRMDAHFTQPLPAELAQSDDPFVRQLLGLGLRPDVMNYNGDDPGYNRRGEAGIDFV